MDARQAARYRRALTTHYATIGRAYGERIGRVLGVVIALALWFFIATRLGFCISLGAILFLPLLLVPLARIAGGVVGAAFGEIVEGIAARIIRRKIVTHLRRLHLAQDSNAFGLLMEALLSPLCAPLRDEITNALRHTTQPNSIQAICRTWLKHHKRGERELAQSLARLIHEERWAAQRPLELRVYTALLSEQLELLDLTKPDTVAVLLEACRDADATIAHNARRALSQLRHPAAIDALCEAFLQSEDACARELILQHDYLPQDAIRRALVLFLSGQEARYEALDPEHTLLAMGYLTASESLQRRLLERARQLGRVDLMRVVVGSNTRKRISELRDREWQAVLEALSAQARWHDMWRLATEAPPYWSKQLLQHLAQVGWDAASLEPEERALYEQLRALLPRLIVAIEPNQRRASLVPHRVIAPSNLHLNDFALTADGKYAVLAANERELQVWHLPDGSLEHTLTLPRLFRALATHPSLPLLAVGMTTELHFYRLPELELDATVPIAAASQIKFFAEGTILACRTHRRRVELYTIQGSEWTLWHRLQRPQEVRDFTLTPNQRALLVASGSGAGVFDIATEEYRRTFGGRAAEATALAYLPRLRFTDWLAIGYDDGLIVILSLPPVPESFAVAARERVRLISGHDPIRALHWIEPEQRLLSVSEFTVHLWLPPNRYPQQQLSFETPIVDAHYAFATNLLAVGTRNHLSLWTDPLSHLIRQPITRYKEGDLEWLEQQLQESTNISATRAWLEFIHALVRHHWRYDIAIEPVVINVGEFDIEIEVTD